MTLSEAIRLGAMLKPQGTGHTFGDKTCALGAALEAVGQTGDAGAGWFPVYQIWPIARQFVRYPGSSPHLVGQTVMIGSACWMLNDQDHWTREEIADWVEQIENAQTTPAESREAATAEQSVRVLCER